MMFILLHLQKLAPIIILASFCKSPLTVKPPLFGLFMISLQSHLQPYSRAPNVAEKRGRSSPGLRSMII